MMVKKAKKPQEIIQFASMWNMDGLIVIGFCDQDYRYLRSHMRIPFVVYDGFCEKPERFVTINIDNYNGGFQVGRHFRQQGHKRVLCLSDNQTGVDKARFDGFRHGFLSPEAPSLISDGISHQSHSKFPNAHSCGDPEISVDFLLVPMTKEERMLHYGRQLALFRSVTAVFAVSDYYAIDLIHFLTAHDLRIPEDISVAGFDDIPLCEMIWPALTTVRQDNVLRAKLALEKLQELKEGINPGEEVILPVSLIVRNSTKAPVR